MRCFLLLCSFILSTVSIRLSSEENAILRRECGKRTSLRSKRSINTEAAGRDEAPWAASVMRTPVWHPNITMEERQKFSRHACSGTLVSPRHVITAASCIGKIDATCDSRGTLTSARLRPLNIDRFSIAFPFSSSTSPDLFLISNVFIGRSYTGFDCSPLTSAYGDIAVIELQENVVYSDSIHPACVMGKEIEVGEKLSLFAYETTGTKVELKKLVSEVFPTCEGSLNDTVCTGHLYAKGCDTDRGAGNISFDRRKAASIVGVWSKTEMSCVQARKRTESGLLKDLSSAIQKHVHWICAATGICFLKELEKTTNEYLEAGITAQWHYTISPLVGDDLYN